MPLSFYGISWKWTNYAPMNCIADVMTNANMFTHNWLSAYEKSDRYSWAIQLKETGEVIGRYFGMHPDDELRQVELACEIGRSWWNQGLMTEATKRVIEFFFREVGMNRIYAWHANENPASGKMQEKAGMKWEGTITLYRPKGMPHSSNMACIPVESLSFLS